MSTWWRPGLRERLSFKVGSNLRLLWFAGFDSQAQQMFLSVLFIRVSEGFRFSAAGKLVAISCSRPNSFYRQENMQNAYWHHISIFLQKWNAIILLSGTILGETHKLSVLEWAMILNDGVSRRTRFYQSQLTSKTFKIFSFSYSNAFCAMSSQMYSLQPRKQGYKR